MTPLGHFSASYLAAQTRAGWPTWPFLLGGLLPDVDFVLFATPAFNALHRRLTHNLFFVAAAAVLAAWIAAAARREKAKPIFAAMAVGGLLHLLLDAIVDGNATNGLGVALCWPVTDWMFCPVNLAEAAQAGWSEPTAMLQRIPAAVAVESPVCLLAAILLWRRLRRKESSLEDSEADH